MAPAMFKYGLLALWVPIAACHWFYYPMSYIAGGIREWYWQGVGGTKSVLVRLLIFVTRLRGAIEVQVTFDEGVDVKKVVKKDEDSGKLVLDLDKRSVFISNHVSYADWIYELFFLYLAEMENAFVFTVPRAFARLPLIGRSMQRFGFVFADKLDEDASAAGEVLFQLGRRATRHKRKLAMLYYPERRISSAQNQVASRAYADKTGATEYKHLLQPRSKALLFSLRTLKLNTPDLGLYDITVAYSTPPSVADSKYPDLAGALASLYSPPSKFHVHVRPFDLAAVPVGEIASADKPKASDRLSPLELDKTLAGDERKAFHAWLTDRWEEKDKMLAYFAEHGEFECAADQRRTLKLELRTIDDYISIFGSYAAFYASIRIARQLIRRAPRWLAALLAFAQRNLSS